MSLAHFLTLLFLSALWGISFIFSRVAVPELGFIPVAMLRVGLGAIFILIYVYVQKHNLNWNRNIRHYCVIGFSNLAFPLTLFSFAAHSIPSAYMAILNATVPFFTPLIGWMLYRDTISVKNFLGLTLGILGVAWISRAGQIDMGRDQVLAFLACVAASISYGFSANYIKRFASHVPSVVLTTGGLCVATIMLLPLLMFDYPHQIPSLKAGLSILGLAGLCTVLAFILFYDLVQKIGMNRAVLVTFLVPIFSGVWGIILLGEQLRVSMLFGAWLIFLGLRIVVKK